MIGCLLLTYTFLALRVQSKRVINLAATEQLRSRHMLLRDAGNEVLFISTGVCCCAVTSGYCCFQ